MATVKQGTLTAASEWWRHLKHMKKDFWKRERKEARRDARDRVRDE